MKHAGISILLASIVGAMAIVPPSSDAAKQNNKQKQQNATVVAPQRAFVVDPTVTNSSGVTGTRAGRATRSRSAVIQPNTAPVVPGSSVGQSSSGIFNSGVTGSTGQSGSSGSSQNLPSSTVPAVRPGVIGQFKPSTVGPMQSSTVPPMQPSIIPATEPETTSTEVFPDSPQPPQGIR